MSPPLTDVQLDELLEEFAVLAGRPRQLQELSGGLTNRNVKVTTADGIYVARCCADAATNMLGIDRDREHHNTKAAAEAGVGAQVIDYRPDLGIMLLRHLDGRTLCNDDFQRPEILDKAAGRRPRAALRPAVPGPLRHVRKASRLPENRPGQRVPAAKRTISSTPTPSTRLRGC